MPELLGWHIHFLALILGLLALEGPAPALSGLVLLWWLARPRLPTAWAHVLLGACFLAGLGLAHLAMPAPADPIPEWMADGGWSTVQGTVESVEPRVGQRLRVVLRRVHAEDRTHGEAPLPGGLAWTWEYPTVRPLPGQVVRAKVKIWPASGFANPGAWDVGRHWAMQGVFLRAWSRSSRAAFELMEPARGLGGAMARAREGLRSRVQELLAPDSPGGSMLLALLFGDRFHLHPDVVDLMRRACLSHTLALSGLHVGLAAGLCWGLVALAGRLWPGLYLRRPRPHLAVALGLPCIALYVWLGGASPSLVRAGIMFAFWGALLLLGRPNVLLDGLFFALACILAVSPLSVFDLRLQLSAAAVAAIGLFLYRPPLGRDRWTLPGLPGGSVTRGALKILLVSVCVNLALLPLVAWHFGEVSPHFWTNLFWLPLLGFGALPLGLLGTALAALGLSAPAGWLLGAASWLLQAGLTGLRALDGWGMLGTMAVFRPGWPAWLGFWTVLLGAFLWARAEWPAKGRAVVLAGLALLAVPQAQASLAGLRHEVVLRLLDVGQGLAVVVEAPQGVRLLVDGGGGFNATRFDIGQAVTAKAITCNRAPALDWVVATHPHADHVDGLAYPLAMFRVGGFGCNGELPDGSSGKRLDRALAASGLEPAAWAAGRGLDLGNGVALEVLHPRQGADLPMVNDRSLALRLTWNGHGLALLPADLEKAGLAALAESGADLSAQVLVLPHHGGRSSVDKAFYAKVGPGLALAGLGRGNMYGYPHRETVRALEDLGVPLYHTARHGALTVRWSSPRARPVLERTID